MADVEAEAEAEAEKPWHSYDTVFLNAKAGMGAVDKEKVQKVVYEMSKGSRFFENEQRKEAELQQRIDKLRSRASQIGPNTIHELKTAVDNRVAELEASRDLSRTWMHVDIDAFYAAVETLDDASLASKPMAVGSMSMICTANYEARKFGVRAAMPGFIAMKLCPELVLIKPDFTKYAHYSGLTREVFGLYDKHFVSRGMDEAYLDITEHCQDRTSSEVAEQLRRDVFEKAKLTCSAGIAPNRLLAKVCSDINKPNGQFVLPNERSAVMTFVSSLPIRKICGIGKVTERLLKEVLSVSTCSGLIEQRYMIAALFSSSSRDFFLSVGLGIGASDTPAEEARKSISGERTFSETSDGKELIKILSDIAQSLAEDMAKEGLHARTVTLKFKTSTFHVRTRGVSLLHHIRTKEEIETHAVKLLKAELPLSLRLLGIRLSHFEDQDPSQKTITSFLQAPSKNSDSDILSTSGLKLHSEQEVVEPEHFEPGEAVESSSKFDSGGAGPFCWGEDEICGTCGVKISSMLPYLRQEHEDYHLAERLQREESELAPRQRTAGVPAAESSNRSRKRKGWETCKSRKPIDVYFSKNPRS